IGGAVLLLSVGWGTKGAVDATFGRGGKVTTAVGTRDDDAYALAIQADGKLVAAGATDVGNNNYDFALVRYNANGALDPTFGAGGKVTTAIGTRDDVASAVAVQADGKLVAAGETGDGTNNYFALARYNASSTPATTSTTLPSPSADINGDGLVDIADALIVAQYDVGLRRCGQPPFTNPAKCDVNQDASCTIGDALRMAQCDVGIVSCTFGCLPLACP